MATINEMLDQAQDALGEGDFDKISEILEDLNSRKRFNDDQRGTLDMLNEALQEWIQAEEDADAEDNASAMASQLARYRTNYVVTISCSGGKSLSNGDDLAQHLEGKPLDYVLSMADQWTPIKDGTPHAVKYAKLNPGSRRMNAGNKLRAACRKGTIMVTDKGIEAGV
jgi:hypothetical protein